MHKKINRSGFTLIELLVVIAIIGILMGLLLPVLAKGKHKARKVKSKSNQGQIAIGYTSYLSDNEGWFPVVQGPAGVGGNTGTAMGEKGPLPKIVAQLYGASVPKEERPLNDHVGSTEVFHDPSDIGGGAYNVQSCWESFGNSYQPQVADDMFRVKRVLGEKTEKEGSYEADSMHESDMIRTDNKIIQGDWTLPNEDILNFLAENKRYGIPYNSLHGPKNIEGIILPEILTVKTLLKTIKQVKE